MSLPYWWHPLQAEPMPIPPTIGDLIPHDHLVWRVVEVNDRPEVDWSDDDRARYHLFIPQVRDRYLPRIMVLRPINAGDTRDHDRHYRIGGAAHHRWNRYPDEHYPICARCLEPLPCREQMAVRSAIAGMEHMERYENPNVCPACREPVTSRQKSLTWQDNIVIPGGPPVTFHSRGKCIGSARSYEQNWAAQDPSRRRLLTCDGSVVNHNDGTYECSTGTDCPGSHARHQAWSTCDCPECHARGLFGCYPGPTARLREES